MGCITTSSTATAHAGVIKAACCNISITSTALLTAHTIVSEYVEREFVVTVEKEEHISIGFFSQSYISVYNNAGELFNHTESRRSLTLAFSI